MGNGNCYNLVGGSLIQVDISSKYGRVIIDHVVSARVYDTLYVVCRFQSRDLVFIETVAEGGGKGANTVCKENNIVTTFGGKLLCSVMGEELGAWTDYL